MPKYCLFSAKGKDFYHQEGNWYAQYRCQKIADDGREIQHIVKDNNDDILYQIVRNIGNKELDISLPCENLVENKPAVHPVGDDIADDVADIEIQVVVWREIGARPGDKRAIKGVDAADNQKQKELLRKKMMLCFIYQVHSNMGRTFKS